MQPEPLHQYVYVSSASRLLSDDELVDLLRTSRENNARDGITGMLLYRGGNFMQAFEGPEGAVRALEARIRQDPRHRDIHGLLDGAVAVRQFPNWTMGFANVERMTEQGEHGVSRLLGSYASAAELVDDPGRALRILVSFRDAMRGV